MLNNSRVHGFAIFFLVLLGCASIAMANDNRKVLPIISDGATSYVTASIYYKEGHSILGGNLTADEKMAIATVRRLIKAAKSDDYESVLSIYDPSDGSRDRYRLDLLPRGYPYRRYKAMLNHSIEGLVRWGERIYVIVGFDYEGKRRNWREDVLCRDGQCWISNNPNVSDPVERAFEFAYAALMGQGAARPADNLDDSAITSQPRVEIFPRKEIGQEAKGEPLIVRYNLDAIRAGKKEGSAWSGDRRLIAGEFRHFRAVLMALDANGEQKKIEETLKGLDPSYNSDYVLDLLKWDAGSPKIVGYYPSAFVTEVTRWGAIKVVGFMGEGEVKYLIVETLGENSRGIQVLPFVRIDDGYRMRLTKYSAIGWQFLRLSPVLKPLYELLKSERD